MIEYFANDKYRVLDCMNKSQISVNGEEIIKLSQQEIADILHFTKPKVNSVISELKKDGYIIQHSCRGKYSLTKKAVVTLKKLNSEENL